MRVGALVLPTDPWPDAVAQVQHLEQLGYTHMWTYDHLSWRRSRDRPWHGIYPWLTGMAAATRTIRLGTMVANPNLRHPLVLARDVMTIDHVSGGRFTLGIGAGGTGDDATILGQEPMTPAERIDRLEEHVGVIDRLLRGQVVDHRGPHVVVEDGRAYPGCVQSPRVPIAIAGGGRRSLRLAADVADGWITYGDMAEPSARGTVAAVRRQWGMIEERCAETGRDPLEIDRVYLIGNTDERPLQSLEAFADFVGRYRGLGFTDVVFHHPRTDDPVWNEPLEIVDEIGAWLSG